ncbi:hypothetical protein KAR91_60480, partial [Candidatus Pacearchaeota archaeon]|nr:hypothetical protein [Candidatus Pacearchaeota archaeon]
MHNIRALPRRIKRRSILQNQRRIAFIKCVQAWKQAIAENKTELWMNSAKNHPQTNKAGKTII